MRNLILALLVTMIALIGWRFYHPNAFRFTASEDAPVHRIKPPPLKYTELLAKHGFQTFAFQCKPERCQLSVRVVGQPVCHGGDLDIIDEKLKSAKQTRVILTLEDVSAIPSAHPVAPAGPRTPTPTPEPVTPAYVVPPLFSTELPVAKLRKEMFGASFDLDFAPQKSSRWLLSVCTDFHKTGRCLDKPHPRVETVTQSHHASDEQVFFTQPLYALQPDELLGFRRDERPIDFTLPLVYRYLTENGLQVPEEEQTLVSSAITTSNSVPFRHYKKQILAILPYFDTRHCAKQGSPKAKH